MIVMLSQAVLPEFVLLVFANTQSFTVVPYFTLDFVSSTGIKQPNQSVNLI